MKPRKERPDIGYQPTPEEIREGCRAIQEEKAREHEAKMQIPAKVYTVYDLRPARVGE